MLGNFGSFIIIKKNRNILNKIINYIGINLINSIG